MRRFQLMLDVTEVEAEQIVKALAPVTSEFANVGIEQAFEDARQAAPPESRVFTLQLRSNASGELGGPKAGIAHEEVS